MHRKTVGILSILTGSFLLEGLVQVAQAVDGVKLINQSTALAGSVTPGDAPGFPVTISRPGSYRLSGNLTVPNENTTAILIATDGVTLDLNGFSILGSTVCTPYPLVCKPTGTGIGVDARDYSNIAVVNGTVRGMGQHGIDIAVGRIERVFAMSNGRNGIIGGFHSILMDNSALLNGGVGIVTAFFGTVSGNVASLNGSNGIAAGDGSAVSNNSASFNEGNGIVAFRGSTVIGNTASSNGQHGLSLNSGVGYSQNVLHGNTLGAVLGGVSLGQNLCHGAVC